MVAEFDVSRFSTVTSGTSSHRLVLLLIMIVIAIFSLMVVAQQAQHFYDNDYEHVDDNEYGCDVSLSPTAFDALPLPCAPCHYRL